MAVKWTDAQREAINARGSNLIVSAAAGSGKTAVLVERVIQMIAGENRCTDIDKLLIVTFTKAAAAEMKQRITEALDKIIKTEINNSNALYQRSLLPNAQISTIDKFTINLVREYFFRLNISQDFSILEKTQESLIEEKVLDEIIENKYAEDSEVFKSLVELFSDTKSDSNLIEAIKNLHYFSSAQAFPFEWLDSMCELYNPDVDFGSSELVKEIREELLTIIDYCLKLVDECYDNLLSNDAKYEQHINVLENDKSVFTNLRQICSDGSWNEMKDALSSFTLMTSVTNQGKLSESSAPIKAIRQRYLNDGNIFSKLVLPLFACTEEEVQKSNEMLYPLIKELISITKEYHNGCMEEKKEINAFSFSDISHFAIDLLVNVDENGNLTETDIAKEYKNSFDGVLVDEYQDTNDTQDRLFSAISDGLNLFMVGDIKQSIYRFRLAMPDIFNKKKNSFVKYSETSDSPNQKIILEKNFRSNADICGFVNFVFRNVMSKQVGEIDYNEEEYLYCGADNKTAFSTPVELNLINVPKTDLSTEEYEAHIIAKRIVEMVNSRELIREGEDSSRPVKYGDIAVLMRKLADKVDVYSKVFTEYGIPVVAENKINLFDNNEIVILLSLLRTIDNPSLDVPLIATLLSVFYGYTPDDIARARTKLKKGNLYSAIALDRDAFSAVLDDLEKYRKYAVSMSVESLIRQILSDTSYLSLISAMGNHEQRRLNVMKLVGITKTFDSGESVGLTAFIRYIDTIIENKTSVESAVVESYTENCVKVMSVHKSKGLEFPVCILAGAGFPYVKKELSADFLRNNKGLGLTCLNREMLYRYDTLQLNYVRNIARFELQSENLRTLYVAITRAKDKFITFASFRNRRIDNYITKCALSVQEGSIPVDEVLFAENDCALLLRCALLYPGCDVEGAECRKAVLLSDNEKTVIKVNVINEESEEETETDEKSTVSASPALVNEIREKLSFKYENGGLSGFAAKRIASSLDDREQSFKYFASKKPSFITGDRLTGAERGTAFHTVMQFCDFKNAATDLNGELNRLKNEGYISEEQLKSLDTEKLKTFFTSALAKRIINSSNVYREFNVSSFVPLSELEDTNSAENVLVIGVADCVFEEDDGLVLVDYKTDRVKDESELLSLYKNQIAFYKTAVEKTLNKRVKEAMLYSFSLGKCCVYK